MPKRTDIKKILIIGSGPIVIGQACEFDYSGTQACKALREEGFRVILVNSNPATIMTAPEMADATYIEPITPEMPADLRAIEKTDQIKRYLSLPNLLVTDYLGFRWYTDGSFRSAASFGVFAPLTASATMLTTMKSAAAPADA